MTKDDPLARMREALIDSYKAKTVEGIQCGLCRADSRPVALHVCDFYEGDHEPRLPCVPLGVNSIGRRWSLPVCSVCAPPCRDCGLPIVTGWIRRAVADLTKVPWGTKAQVGLGVCKHLNLTTALKSLHRRPYWTAADLTAAFTMDQSRNHGQSRPEKLPVNQSGPTMKRAQADCAPQPDFRAALKRQYAGWDIGNHGGLETFTRYADQPSGFKLRLSFIPLSASRVNVFAALIPPPDELACDRSKAINSIQHVLLGLGKHDLDLKDVHATLLGNHGVQIDGWCDFRRLLDVLTGGDVEEQYFFLVIFADEPYSRQLGGQPLVVSAAGLVDRISEVADRRAKGGS